MVTAYCQPYTAFISPLKHLQSTGSMSATGANIDCILNTKSSVNSNHYYVLNFDKMQ